MLKIKSLAMLTLVGLIVIYQPKHLVADNINSFEPIYSAENISTGSALSESDKRLLLAFENKEKDLQIEGQGRVIKILADDNKGIRHQRFILKLNSGQTLLVAHNIDLSPRINGLEKGDRVYFYGEYEWNAKGGVIHWTHKDPAGRHPHGWLKHQGRLYQ